MICFSDFADDAMTPATSETMTPATPQQSDPVASAEAAAAQAAIDAKPGVFTYVAGGIAAWLVYTAIFAPK
jgi:hypothetical protein